ncbi:hypothetical protein [Chitinophaga niabensis]|uniref:Uncharacterized protein n=1 Tax=Chitinophaga niabensis TaxID=536979 RepID=A0A1N6KBU6_9BACT|nr:hypothetical protein [Chitinophaga niabensis]SIO53923.1 hypothetical protein SAMN04488055_5505 [Chitinophaga niabensis]
MNKKNFKDQLNEMIGKTFQYGNSIHCVISYKTDEEREKCILQTNLSTFEKPFEAMNEFLKYWKPTSSIMSLPTEIDYNQQVTLILDEGNNLSSQLIKTLTETIDNVKNNKEYIPQAQTIVNSTNTIVNIEKMRLSYLKLKIAFGK